ncbi:MAG: EAL domain-containing protein [Acidobacteria bacterium]|nr:EAL domain-containing protein [Acidobacteriota bacterium]
MPAEKTSPAFNSPFVAGSAADRPEAGSEADLRSTLQSVLEGKLPFGFCYQPIVDLHRGVAVGYEALVRFQGRVPLSPDKWFAAAERFGQRPELEELVTRQAILSRRHLPANCFLTINVSPSFLLSSRWDAILESHRSLAGVVVEITENESVAEYAEVHKKIKAVRERSGLLAVDDAGSGYSSLKHVMELKPEFVKLDRIFVTDCDSDCAKSALIEMVGAAAGRLDAWVIAEGIETSDELDELIRLSVPLGQGYWLGRPVPEMCPVDQEKADGIRSRVKAAQSAETVALSTEKCPVYENLEEAEALLANSDRVDLAVVVDGWGRPSRVVQRHPLAGVRTLSEFLKAQPEHSAQDTLERALTRPPDQRFDPLAVTDAQGTLEGVVRVDRLMRQMLTADRHARISAAGAQRKTH